MQTTSSQGAERDDLGDLPCEENIEKYVEIMTDSVVGEVVYGYTDFVEAEETVVSAPDVTFTSNEQANPTEANKTDTEINDQQPEGYNRQVARIFEERQKKYLTGRRVTKDLTDEAGNIIVEEGTVIDEGIIELVKAKGKMVELSMNNSR